LTWSIVQELPRRTGFSGPKLIRLLARLKDADVPESTQSSSDRLSLWLGWTDAIALSTALTGTQAMPAGARALDGAEEREYARVRTALENAITGSDAPAASRQRGQRRAPVQDDGKAAAVVDYSAYRRRYVYLQQTMETGIGNLRRHLRTRLTSTTPEMARLAVVDAVMERALSAREHSLLAGVPALLEEHFQHLLQAEQAALADDPASEESPAAPTGAWLDRFRKDMQSVLLAELDIRLQPIEGLLAALRSC
jgi:hypothetical protein